MFFVMRSNDSFNFPLGLINYIVIDIVIYIYIGPWLYVSCSKMCPSLVVLCQLEQKVSNERAKHAAFRALELCESRGGRLELPGPNSSYGLCGRKATLTSK